MAWWSRKKKMKVDLIETSSTDALYKIVPNGPDSYFVYRKYNWVPNRTDPWLYQTTFSSLKEAEKYVKEKIDWNRQYEEKKKRNKEFQAKNPTRYYA